QHGERPGKTRYRTHGLEQEQNGEINRNEDEQAGNERLRNEFNELFHRQAFLVERSEIKNQKSNIGNTSGVDFGQNVGDSLLQLAGSEPIFSPRSVKLFMVSFTKVPAHRRVPIAGDRRDAPPPPCACAALPRPSRRCRTAVAVEARVTVSRLR